MITLNDTKILKEVIPEVEQLFTTGQWTREQAQQALGMAYNELTSEEGQRILLQIHDGLEAKKGSE